MRAKSKTHSCVNGTEASCGGLYYQTTTSSQRQKIVAVVLKVGCTIQLVAHAVAVQDSCAGAAESSIALKRW